MGPQQVGLLLQEKSFFQIFDEFDALDPKDRTAKNLTEIVNGGMPLKITLDDSVAILTCDRCGATDDRDRSRGVARAFCSIRRSTVIIAFDILSPGKQQYV